METAGASVDQKYSESSNGPSSASVSLHGGIASPMAALGMLVP